jgi:hypothetical protein
VRKWWNWLKNDRGPASIVVGWVSLVCFITAIMETFRSGYWVAAIWGGVGWLALVVAELLRMRFKARQARGDGNP